MDDRPLVGRHVALRREDRHVEAGVPRPGAAHAVIEVESVHLGADQVPVDPFRHGPILRGSAAQPRLPLREFLLLPRHGRRRVVRHAIHEPGALECPPFVEQIHEVGVGVRTRRRNRIHRIRRHLHEKEDEGENRDSRKDERWTESAACHGASWRV